VPKTAPFDAVLHAHRPCADRFLADRLLADRFLADRSLADRFLADRLLADRSSARRLSAPALATTNAALATTNTGTHTGKTPFARTNAALMITTDLPRIQSSSRSCPRMQHSTPRITHSCSRRKCPVLNHLEGSQLLSSLSTLASPTESNGCKTVSPGDTPSQAKEPSPTTLPTTAFSKQETAQYLSATSEAEVDGRPDQRSLYSLLGGEPGDGCCRSAAMLSSPLTY